MAEGDVGVVGGVNAPLPILMTMAAFLSIALYNVLEITALIFTAFKQRTGLYFWSFLVATWGIAPHAVGFILKFFQITKLDLLSSAIVGVGWACMVIGQSLVLYSRLHLVVHDRTRIRWILYMIIFNGIILGIPLFVLAMGTNSKHSTHFLPGFLIYDKVQIVVISVQETIISIIYIYNTVLLLGQGSGNDRPKPLQKLLRHLIFVNILVLIFDITLLAVQFSGHYEIQTTYKTAVYSFKLKIEFSVLNRLVSMVKHRDLISNPRTFTSNTFSMARWTRSKRSQVSTDPSGYSASPTVGGISLSDKRGLDISVTTSEVHLDQAETVNTENNSLYSEPPEVQFCSSEHTPISKGFQSV
jgi:hypothetical protein